MALSVLYIIIAAITLGAALMVVTVRNLVHAALWLILTLFGVAVIFVLLQAGFLAIVQVIVYIGAIAILMIFAIMLTRKIAQDTSLRFNPNWLWGVLLALTLFAALVWMLSGWTDAFSLADPINPSADSLRELGTALVSPDAFVLPFELASVLLLAALIGAIVVSWERK